MRKFKISVGVLLAAIVSAFLLVGCGSTDVVTSNANNEEEKSVEAIGIEDGVYLADFDTDSTMFHVNEACKGKGILTVEGGKGTIHIALTSKNIVNLFEGVVEDAEKDGAILLEPTVEEVKFDDGTVEEVNAFDVTVPYLDEEFDLALIGAKGKWYDHKVSVSNPTPYDESAATADEATEEPVEESQVESVEVTLEGGSGKSTVESPAMIKTGDDGQKYVIIIWSSPNYDYMILDGEKYLPVNEDGNSTFELPITETDCVLEVIADTVAMSKPHEIEYTLTLKPNN